MTSLIHLTMKEVIDGLSRGDFSARALCDAHLKAIESQKALNTFITVTAERARADADASDARRQSGDTLSALDGVPIANKDLFCTQGIRSTAGSRILGNFIPPYESTVSQRLKDAGTVMLGKLNMDEFAMGSATTHSAYGPAVNPWRSTQDTDKLLTPGGSSGGSAAAVSAYLCTGATGTDTGGSIRQPAGFVGIVGLKPTYGRCSRYGIVAFASSLDQAGPMTRTVYDSALMLNHMAGHDAKDSTSAEVNTPDFTAGLEHPPSLKGVRVGIPKEYTMDGMDKEITALWEQGAAWLRAQGAEVKDVSLPHTRHALSVYYIVAPAEASSNLARYDGVRFGLRDTGTHGAELEQIADLDAMYCHTRAAGFGDEVKRRLLIGTYVLSSGCFDAYYVRAQRVRTLIAEDFNKAFDQVDVLLTPTAPSAAFGIHDHHDDPVVMYLNDVFTVPASLAGLPAVSVPAGLSAAGLPLGLQLIAKPFDEVGLLKAARALEEAAGFVLPHDHARGVA